MKKLLAIVLASLMVISLVPVTASADEVTRDAAKSDGKLYVPAADLNQIADLEKNSNLIIVLKDPSDNQTKALGWDEDGTDPKWLIDVDVHQDDIGSFLVVEEGSEYLFSIKDSTLDNNRVRGKIKLEESSGNKSFDPDGLSSDYSNGPYKNGDTYAYIYASGEQFYLRGASGDEFFGYKDGKFVCGTDKTVTLDPSDYVLVDIYVKVASDTRPVYLYDYAGNIRGTQYVKANSEEKYIYKPAAPTGGDIIVGDIVYTLLGWSTDSQFKGKNNLLSDTYINLYDYDKDANGYGIADESLYETYSLIKYDKKATNTGTNEGTPRANEFESIEITGESLSLYPIYVRGGYNTIVEASAPSGAKIQVSSTAKENKTDPRWLGTINVEIYNDGELVNGGSTTMHFYYNSDNMADVQLILSGGGDYVINAVVAEQGGSSNGKGLTVMSNYLLPNTGKLDNVIGGSTIKIYMSTRYTAKYFLDGQETSIGTSGEEYSTEKSFNAFETELNSALGGIDGKYIVGGEHTDYTKVTDVNFLEEHDNNDDSTYSANGNIKHGGKYKFGYLVKTYGHSLTVPAATSADIGLTEDDLLNGNQWLLGGNKVDPGSFSVSDNVSRADKNGVFNFYAFTTGSLKVEKKVTGIGADMTKSFSFKVALHYPVGSGLTDEEKTFTLQSGQSYTIEKLPTGTTYTVSEEDVPDGFTPAFDGSSTGSIARGVQSQVTVTNNYVPKTGSLTIKNTTNLNGGTYGSDFTYTITSAGAVFESEKNYGAGVYVDDHTLTVTVAQNGQVTVTGLPTAAYTVAQTAPAAVPQWTWGDVKSGAGTPGGTADPTTGVGATLADVAVADSQTTLVLFENVLTRKTGSLTIKKALTGDPVVGTPEFTFTIQAPAGVTFGAASDYGTGVTKDSSGNLTVTVAANNTVTVSNLPVGTYTVIETGKENYSLSGVAGGTQTTNGFTVTVGDGTTTAVTVTNNYAAPAPKTGSLRILKRVTGEDVNVRQDFTFRIYPQSGTPMAEGAVSGATAYGDYYEAKVTFGLGSNSVTVSGLPEGSYRVEELTSNLAPGLFADPIYDKTTVEVRQNATADITVTNPVNTGTLTLNKTVVPDTESTLPAGIEGKEFSFTVSLNLPAGVNSAAVTVNGVKQTVERTGEISVKLKKDGSVQIGNIPYGTTYSVKENLIGADEHFYSDKYTTGNETDTLTSANVSVSCQNTYSKTATNTGTLRLRKVTQGQTDQTEFTFTVTFTPPVDTTHEDLFRVFKQEQGLDANNSKTYTVKKGESLLITNIPVGTTYTIQETFNNIAAAKRPTEVAAEFESGTKETTDSITGTGLGIVARGTINADADGDQVTFYNRYLIDLVITKEVKGEGKPSANTEYVFTLEFSGFTADELDQLKNVMEITDATGTRSYDKLIEDFRADNKVTIYLTEEHPTATVNKVPSGRSHYNVEEINSRGAETVEVTVGTEKITGSSTGFKQMSPETAKVTFTNTFVIKTGKLTVKVEATGEGKKPGAEEKYTVHVELTDKNGDPVNGTYGGKEFKDGKADFQLGDGESVVLENLPYGTKYTVTETDKLGADTVTGEVKTEREFVGNTTVEIQNEYKKAPSGSLTIKKALTGDTVVGTPEFTFTVQAPAGVTFGNASDYGTGVTKDSNGNLTVTVKANNTVTVSNLPVGTYTVIETGKENYSLSGVNGGTQTTNGFTVTVGDGTTTAVTVTNNYTAPAPKTGSLRILKRVTGEDVTVRQDFTFRIYPQSGTPMAEGAVSGATAYADYYEAKVTFGLGSNSVTVSGLPEGSYRVEELTSNLAPGLFADPVYDKTTVEVGQNATADITVTNPVNTGTLTLSKTVVPAAGDTLSAGIEGKEFSFTVSLNLPAGVNSAAVTVNGVKQTVERTGEISVKLKKDGSVQIGNIPYGTTYSVKENLIGADEHFYSDKYTTGNETDTLNSANVTVSCQNTYSQTATDTGTLRLRKVTQGQTDQTEFTFTVTFTAPADTTHEDLFRLFKQEQGLDANNSKTYTVKKGESLLITNIPVGTTYTIQETFNGIVSSKQPTEVAAEFESGTKETTDSISGTGLGIVAQGKIDRDADGDQVTFYNRYLIDLVITKEVKGEGKPDANTQYVFTLEFSGFTADELDQLKNVMEITDATGTRSYDKLIEDFRADNKVTIYLTEAHPTATVNKVPSGRSHYNVEEINSRGAETVEVTVGTEKITGTSTGFKQMSPETAKVTFTNTFVIKTGKLTVKVEATGEGKKPGAEEKYTVHVELTDKNGDPVNGTFGGKEFKDGKADFRLGDGESVVLESLPYGTKYTVTETDKLGADTVAGEVKTERELVGNTTVEIQNEYKKAPSGSLTIKKALTGDTVVGTPEFTFTVQAPAGVTFGNASDYGTGVTKDSNGNLTVTVKANNTVTVSNLPVGTYTVIETGKENYSLSGVAGGTKATNGFTVTVGDGTATAVTVTNNYTAPAPKTGSLTIKKALTGNPVVGTPEFTFTVQAPAGVTFGNASDYGTGVTKDSNGNLTVTVKAGDTAGVMVSNLPVGTYTVVETGKENYSLSGVTGGTKTTNGFTVTVSDGTTTAVTVTNKYTVPAPKTGSLRILKRVTGEDVAVRQDFTFRIYPQNGTPMAEGAVSGATAYAGYYEAKVTFGLGSNSITVSGLPEGSYRVEELTSNLAPGLFADPVYDKTTVEVRQNATADIAVTNPVNTGTLTLSKTVVPDTGSTLPAGIGGKEFSFTVSLNLPAGVNSAAVTVNGVKQTVERTGEISVKLKKDEEIKIGNIPYGTTYSVKENLIGADEHFYSDKYTTGNETDTLNSANVTVSCQNTYSQTARDTGTLRLRKVTQGQTDQTEFTFTVTFTPPVDTTHEDLFRVFKQEQGLDANNSKTYTVKKGESLLITNIPVGTTYTIQETFNNIAAAKRPTEVAAEFESGTKETSDSITGSGLNIVARGTINADADGDQVTFYNRYLIDLVITKEVKGEGKPSANTEYVFTLEFSGFTADELDQLKNVMEITDATGTRSYTDLIEDFRADNKVTIYLTEAHPTATVNKVPSGRSHYNVEEINSQGAETVEVTVGTEKITGSSTGFKQMSPETAKVTFTNTFVIKTGKLTVKVEATGEGKKPGAEEKYTVHVELTDKNGDPVNGTYGGKEFKDGKADFQLGDGESVVLENLPYGTKYTVTETDKLGADTVAGEVKTQREFVGNTTVEIQNEYKKAPSGGGVTPPPTGDDVLNKAEHFGYIIGVPGKEVRPEQNITRAEIVTILFRLLTDEARQAYWGEDSGFTDVQKGVWYNHAVATLHNLGIIQGDGSGRFKPMEMITRAEVAAMVVRFREKSDSIKLENRFTDVAEGKWYTDEVLLADFYGLMEGDGSNRFKPEDKLTRAEAMTVFNRLLERKPHKDHLLPGMITWSDNMDTGRWYYAQIQEATNSHKCGQDVIIDGKVYETWSEITPMRDWAALEY